jgi:hypothetical protein
MYGCLRMCSVMVEVFCWPNLSYKESCCLCKKLPDEVHLTDTARKQGCTMDPVVVWVLRATRGCPHPMSILNNQCLGLSSRLFYSDFPTKIPCAYYTSLMHTPTYLIILDFIKLIIFGDGTKYDILHYCNFLHPPATSSILGPNMFLSTLFSNTLFPYGESPCFTPK